MAKNNVVFNLSLDQYNKKYCNRSYRLVKYTKKEVEEFDIKNDSSDKLLLRKRKWALIGNTYYEIPKPIRFTWFRNLHIGVQIGTCILASGIVATAITLPIIFTRNKSYIVNEEQWINAFDRVLNDKKERNVNIVYSGVIYTNTTPSVGQEQKAISSIEASLKIIDDKEYGDAHMNLEYTGIKSTRQDRYYQKKINNQIVSKTHSKIDDQEWRWDHDTYQLDDKGYQSTHLYISEARDQYNKFALQNNCYVGKIKVDIEEFRYLGIDTDLTFKIEFNNNLIKNIDFNFNYEKEISGGYYRKISSGMNYTLSFQDYGSTSFTLPE